jgi:hypothetical protein
VDDYEEIWMNGCVLKAREKGHGYGITYLGLILRVFLYLKWAGTVDTRRGIRRLDNSANESKTDTNIIPRFQAVKVISRIVIRGGTEARIDA